MDMDTLRFRAMTAGDVAAVARLEQRIFTDAWTEEAFRREVEGGAHCLPEVAETAAGDLAGYMVAWVVADEVHLGNLAVVPEHRRQGLAQRFLDRLLDTARRRGARMITLEVRRSNRPARALYEKNGFYPVLVRHRYYRDNGEDALVMVKALTPEGAIPPLRDLQAEGS